MRNGMIDEKISCSICGHRAHVLFTHVREAHNMSASEYTAACNDAPLFSGVGAKVVQAIIHDAEQMSVETARETRTVPLGTLFSDVPKLCAESFEVTQYIGDSPWVPVGDDTGYQYDYDATMSLLYALQRPKRSAVWIAGYAGVGKTQLVLHVCRRLNREVIRINLDSTISRGDLIGDWIVKGGATKFNYGLLPMAMRRGAVLLLDEIDLVNPYVLALLRPVLEETPRLAILENGGEIIEAAPGFAIVATANTFGTGDDSGLYGTTQTISVADRQRFSLFIHLGYLAPENEKTMLLASVANLTEYAAIELVRIANRIREQYKAGKIEESISPRQLINWAEIYVDSGDPVLAANMAFLLPLNTATQIAIRQLISEGDFESVKAG